MYLIDTNVISELRKPRPHGGVLAWFERMPADLIATSACVIYELQAGANRTREQDPDKATELDDWIARIPGRMRVIPFGEEEARMTAHILTGKSLQLFPDAMIAATAVVQGLTVATRNVADFRQFPVALMNPFDLPR